MNDMASNVDTFSTPVLLVVFNRPDTTARVFDEIRRIRPARLYIGADGPRDERPGERERCREVRRIATNVDWPCDVFTLFRDENVGCAQAVGGAIQWFFENEQEGIVLEDDCLPSQSFFRFCASLLAAYRDNPRIYLVSGENKQNTWKNDECDYFYSNFGGISGWASWRRAWQAFDRNMAGLEEFSRLGQFEKSLGRKLGKLRRRQITKAKRLIESGKINSWAFPWAVARHLQGGLACVPSVSLIENIGFGEHATHSPRRTGPVVERHEISFPLRENSRIVPDEEYDLRFLESERILSKLKSRLMHLLFPPT